jgi:hypothetical protein
MNLKIIPSAQNPPALAEPAGTDYGIFGAVIPALKSDIVPNTELLKHGYSSRKCV